MRASNLCVRVSLTAVLALVGCSDSKENRGVGADTQDGGVDDDAAPGLLGNSDGSVGGPKPGECAPNLANYDFPGNNCDDDADGMVDNAPAACDAALAIDGDGAAFAKSIGICQTAEANQVKWGLVSATFTTSHISTIAPNALQHGILGKYGALVKPREGGALGVLSTGFAREFDEETGTTKPFKGVQTKPMQPGANGGGSLPPGFPKSAMGCPSQATTSAHDLIDAKLEIRVPKNANGVQFDFNFWSGEWPEYVCSEFNDAFIAFLTSKAFGNGAGGNMSFDAQGNPVSVNNGFFDHCTPNATTGCLAMGGMMKTAACPGGTSELAGTGFEFPGTYCGVKASGGGATGWLTSKAPVTPGETITLEFVIWDVGDPNYDSSVLLDHFQWVEGTTDPTTERPPR